jgi:TetR/AcrR family transcriptional repressor of mexJK operon
VSQARPGYGCEDELFKKVPAMGGGKCGGEDVLDTGVRARGRPRTIAESERRRKVIEAAEHVFVELGYGAASVDDIAHRAAMSKKTIYQLYATKGELFAAVIAARREELAAMIGAECCDGVATHEQILRRFLSAVARFVLAPRQSALYRLVIAESQRAPELAHAFYREGPIKAKVALTEWLTLQDKLESLRVPDPQSAASMLLSMVISELQMRSLICELSQPAETMIEERVKSAVALFLEGALPRP